MNELVLVTCPALLTSFDLEAKPDLESASGGGGTGMLASPGQACGSAGGGHSSH
jgi:hypothetical protein